MSNMPAAKPGSDTPTPRLDGLRVIALFKFGKALLLLLTGYGVHKLLDVRLLERVHSWTSSLTDHFAQRMILQGLSFVEGLGAKKIHLVIALTLVSTVVVLTEGIGLWLRRGWAEWLTTCATASLLPLELWELITRPMERKLPVLVTLILNLAVVWYLIWHLRRKAQARRLAEAPGSGV